MYKVIRRIYIALLFTLFLPVYSDAQDTSLNELIKIALQNNQDVKSSVLDVSVSEKRVSEVKSNMLPQVNVSGDYKYYTKIPIQLMPVGGDFYQSVEISTPWNLGTTVSVGQLIYSQEYITGVQLANTGKEISKLLVRKSKEDVAYNISATYYNAQIINSQLNFIRNNIINMEKMISTGELLYENQMIKYSDVDKLKLNKTMLETQEQTVKVSYNEVINMLKLLSGIPQSDNLKINNDISTKVDILPYSKVKPERVELKLLEKQKELNEFERKNIFAGYLPSISAYGVYYSSFYGKGGDASFLKGYPGTWLGLRLSWNLFDGLGRKSKIQQKDIEYRKLDLKINQLNENISMELNNAKNQVVLQESTIQNRKEQLALAEKIYGQVQLQFKEGLVNITDVLQSDNSLREAQNNYIISTIKLLNAQLSWKKAAGKLLND